MGKTGSRKASKKGTSSGIAKPMPSTSVVEVPDGEGTTAAVDKVLRSYVRAGWMEADQARWVGGYVVGGDGGAAF